MILRPFILLFIIVPLISYGQKQSIIYQINYGVGISELSSQNKQILSSISDTLLSKNDYVIYINGHTDSDADSNYNQQLSLRRSLIVKDFLIEKGINESLIRVRAKGEEQPLVTNSTPLEKAKNRRVEIVVLYAQKPQEKVIEMKNEITTPACNRDTTVILEDGYILTLSVSDWIINSECLLVAKRFTNKFNIKENWLKKRIGFKNYTKAISCEPHYEFQIVACNNNCFKNKMKLYIPQYNAPGLILNERYSQKKNDKNQSTSLTFKKLKLSDSAYYSAEIYCPGTINCSKDNRCIHPVTLHAKNKISILSYSYYDRSSTFYNDSLVEIKPSTSKSLTDIYTHTFFHTLNLLYKGDTIILKDIPIDVFAHGLRKIIPDEHKTYKTYFLFIPIRKKDKCEHYKKYKIKSNNIENLKHFNLLDLQIDNK